MNTSLTAQEIETLLQKLDRLQSLSSTSATTADIARFWIQALKSDISYLADTSHSVVFLGPVGVGKSTLIGVSSDLVLNSNLPDKASLKKNLILSTGAGRTTLCEVHVTRSREAKEITLLITPMTIGEMTREITDYAHDEWMKRNKDDLAIDDGGDPTPQELQRAIREMTGYSEYSAPININEPKKRRVLRPIDGAILDFSNAGSFANHLLEKAKLQERTQTKWQWKSDSSSAWQELKEKIDAINRGAEPHAPLPSRMLITTPRELPGHEFDLTTTLIDTRGLDGGIDSRVDLQSALRNPRSLIVICTTFKDAPGESTRQLLSAMNTDAELRRALDRTILVLVDQGDAAQVNDADGDREVGQQLKIAECRNALDDAGLQVLTRPNQITSFDVLNDDPASLKATISTSLDYIRKSKENTLNKSALDASAFFSASASEIQKGLREKIDHQILSSISAFPLIGAPLADPLVGAYASIDRTRYASVVYATCRRNGAYYGLDIYAAIEAEASRAATAWLDKSIGPALSLLTRLETEDLMDTGDHIRLRKSELEEGQIRVVRAYARSVAAEVRQQLEPDQIWGATQDEWGRGQGFKRRVAKLLENWSRQTILFEAHEVTNAREEIPFLSAALDRPHPPHFTLHVRNLRSLRNISWELNNFSILIGANGTGKSTLVETLRLMRLSFELDLPQAVTLVLGGSSNLKSWGADDEPIEFGIDLMDISWRVQLIPREGSVDYATQETLTQGSRTIFSRNALGEFRYGNETIPPSRLLGLRVLFDLGVDETSIGLIAALVKRVSVFRDPDLWNLRMYGSPNSDYRELGMRGLNTFAVLHYWRTTPDHKSKFDFVSEGLAEAFPSLVGEIITFVEGTTTLARILKPKTNVANPIADEANGVLQLNRPGFRRHQSAINYGSDGGVCEREAVHR